jgi:hypothetical protein
MSKLQRHALHASTPVIELPRFVFPAPERHLPPRDWELLVRFAYLFVIRSPESVWIFRTRSAKINDNHWPYAVTVDQLRDRHFTLGVGSSGFSTLEYFADRVQNVSARYKTAPFALYGGFRFQRIIPRYLRYTTEVLPGGLFEDGELEFRAESELDAQLRESELDARLR